MVDEKTCLELAHLNAEYKVNKFSFVTSGKALSDRNIDMLCHYARKIGQETGIKLCASMGLLNKAQLQKLIDAGITRYHCNLESSADFFPLLCSTHTTEDKLETHPGCPGSGNGNLFRRYYWKGESMEDRISLALVVRLKDKVDTYQYIESHSRNTVGGDPSSVG